MSDGHPMFSRRRLSQLLLAAVLALWGGGLAFADTLRVGAAISLREALSDVAKSYEAETGNKVELAFASSGQVAGQIRAGGDLDVFVSAAADVVTALEKEGLADSGATRTVARNALVLIVPAERGGGGAGAKDVTGFEALKDGSGKVAVGEPRSVPAGAYAAQVLKFFKLWPAIQDRLVYGTNVRQVLSYVERGEVTAGMVYATDAREAGARVRVVGTAPKASHDAIVYPATVVSASKRRELAKGFVNFLLTQKAQASLAGKGFLAP